MKIYKSEIEDGLEGALKNNSIACCAIAEKSEPVSILEIDDATQQRLENLGIATAENKNQIDLYYLKSILVSTGWNKNDDVFDPKELWTAKDTPEDKPFNFMHNEKDIIGHITGNMAVDFNGEEIEQETEEVPSSFNILTTSVIYTEWSDIAQRERMQKIVSEIEDGKWFVSMECLFPDFDYALATSDDLIKVIPRNEASAFLTKHLRSYGGNGKYQDYRVGRLLRNLSFSGKGLVSKPANPNSVILDRTGSLGGKDITYAKEITLTESKSYFKEKDMSDSYEKQIDDLRAELAEAKSANEALQEKVAAEQQAEFDAKISTFEATLAEKDTQISAITEEKTALAEAVAVKETDIQSLTKDIDETQKELAAMKKREAMMKRQAQLAEAGFDADEATATVEQFEAMDDDTFDQVVALMKKKGKEMPWDKDKKEEEEEKAIKKDTKAEETVLEEEVETSEASETDLESVEETEEVAIAEAVGEDDPAESLRAQASEWLGSVLQSVPKDSK